MRVQTDDNLTIEHTFLKQLFRPNNFSAKRSMQLISSIGGISYILNCLNVFHKQGLSNYKDYTLRCNKYGKNCIPKSQNLMKKYFNAERDFTINLLLYLLTVQMCIKLLLWKQGRPSQSIIDELINYVLVLTMVLLKALVNVQYFNLDTDERKYRNEMVSVRRDGQIIMICQQQILVGDILLINSKNSVRVDGILLTSKKLLMNESQTILRKDSTWKNSIWDVNSIDNTIIDPFVLSGSKVVSGQGEILVCLIGESCSFRMHHKQINNFVEQSSIVTQSKILIQKTQNIGKQVAILFATIKFISYVWNEWNNEWNWLSFLHIINVYSCFIGLGCFLLRLKIVRSMQFFLEGHSSGSHYRIQKQQTLERLSDLDVLFLEEQVISIKTIKDRDEQISYADRMDFLSNLNRLLSIKIITTKTKKQILQLYGQGINDNKFYQFQSQISSRMNLSNLINCTFLINCHKEFFINQLLPIYQNLQYKIGYLTLGNHNLFIAKNILHIKFNRLSSEGIIANQGDNNNNNNGDCHQQFWVRLQNLLMMEDIVEQIMLQSYAFRQLYIGYLSLFVNNITLFVLLCWSSLWLGTTFDLYWSLLIIIGNRYTFFTVYRRIALQTDHHKCTLPKNTSHFQVIKFNLFLIPYYFYVVTMLTYKLNIFLFLLSNSMFRVQVLLFKIKPYKSLKLMLQYLIGIVVVNLINIAVYWNQSSHFENVLSLFYTLGLAMIYMFYTILI